jgi:hypothetical protein
MSGKGSWRTRFQLADGNLWHELHDFRVCLLWGNFEYFTAAADFADSDSAKTATSFSVSPRAATYPEFKNAPAATKRNAHSTAPRSIALPFPCRCFIIMN